MGAPSESAEVWVPMQVESWERLGELVEEQQLEGRTFDLLEACRAFAGNRFSEVANQLEHWRLTDEAALDRSHLILVACAVRMALSEGWATELALENDWRPSEVLTELDRILIAIASQRSLTEEVERVLKAFDSGDGAHLVHVICTQLRTAAGMDQDPYDVLLDAKMWYPSLYRTREELVSSAW